MIFLRKFPSFLIYLKVSFRIKGKFYFHLFFFFFCLLFICSCTWWRWHAVTIGEAWPRSPSSSFTDFTAKCRSSSPRWLSQSKALSPHLIGPSELALEQRGKWWLRGFLVGSDTQCLMQRGSPSSTWARRPLYTKQIKVANFLFCFQPLIVLDGKKNQSLFHFSFLIGENCFISFF